MTTNVAAREYSAEDLALFEEIKNVESGMQRVPLQVGSLPSGAYLLEISDDKNVIQQKFLKQ